MNPVWTTSGEADEEFLATLEREKAYSHWTEEERRIFELCLKWFYETHAEAGQCAT